MDLHEQRRAEMVSLALRHAAEDGLHATAVDRLQLVRASAPALRLPAVYEPGLVVVLQGRKQVLVGEEAVHYDPLHCLVVSVTVPTIGRILEATPGRPYLCVRLGLDPGLVAELLLQSPEPHPAEPLGRGLRACAVDAPLVEAVLRLMRLLDEPQHAPALAPLVTREIHYRLLAGELGPQLRQTALAGSTAQRIARAIEWLKQRYDQPVRMEELAASVHMSVSGLHHRFKQVTALSPLQFQKQLRLHAARRLMLMEGLEASTAGHRVGYESASQFSREYRRLFGAPPRAEIDLVRGRGRPEDARPAERPRDAAVSAA